MPKVSIAAAILIAACGVTVPDVAPTVGTSTTGPVTTTPVTTTPVTTTPVTTTPVTTTPVTTTPVTGSSTPTARSPATTEPPTAVPGCGATLDEFHTEGRLGVFGSTGSDGQQISRLSVEGSGTCERFEVALDTLDGAPAARLPVTEVELLPHSGVVRIRFDRTVVTTTVTDSVLEGRFVERAFVVRGLDGWLFVDVHLAAEVAARAFVREDTGALAVELWDLGGPGPRFPEVSQFVVVTSPTTRAVDYPLVVTGYSRTFEANVIGEFRTDEGREIAAVTSAADYIEMWGEFRLEIEEGPAGLITLFVGDYPPVDGAPPEGVELEFMAV